MDPSHNHESETGDDEEMGTPQDTTSPISPVKQQEIEYEEIDVSQVKVTHKLKQNVVEELQSRREPVGSEIRRSKRHRGPQPRE